MISSYKENVLSMWTWVKLLSHDKWYQKIMVGVTFVSCFKRNHLEETSSKLELTFFMGNWFDMFGECHTPCMLKTPFVVFEKE